MTYNLTDDLVRGVMHFEGYADKAYTCPAGKLTIGYGHVLTLAEVGRLVSITQAQAEQLLRDDLQAYAVHVARLLPGIQETQHQFDAITSWTYNLGVGALDRSTLRRYHNSGDYDEAAKQISRWVYIHVDGKPVALGGLKRRRKWERAVYERGAYDIPA